jgi:exodeoxyribonuclease-3
MKIATWNVNSVRVRLENITEWLNQTQPDVACLQEIKAPDDVFPGHVFEELGYNVAVHGQKGFNGVAMLSKHPFDEVLPRLPGDDADEQARYLECVISTETGVVRVASIYLPNGNPTDTDKFPYKLKWMERLHAHAQGLIELEEPLVLAGDYNVIPQPGDVHDPVAWEGDALCRAETRQRFRALLNLGLTDAFRACSDAAGQYTFWDYQAGAWQKNHGIRIDHLLLSPQASDLLRRCAIDKDVRAWEKPSDHVPIWVELAA